MKIITKTIDLKRGKDPLHQWLKSSKVAYLDIETTGLSPKYASIILMGIVKTNPQSNNSGKLMQYLCSCPSEEKQLLQWTLEALEDVDILITYNGARFDIPFINQRLAKHKLPSLKQGIHHIDILQLVKQYSHLNQLLPNLKQKTIETFLKRDKSRLDEITGADSVTMYNTYVETGSLELEKTILLHNHDDIYQLSTLTEISANCNYHKYLCDKGIPLNISQEKNQHTFAQITPRLNGEKLTINGYCTQLPNYCSFFTPSMDFQANVNQCQLLFEFNLQSINQFCTIDLTPFEKNFSDKSKLWLSKQPLYSDGYFVLATGKETHYYPLAVISALLTKEICRRISQ